MKRSRQIGRQIGRLLGAVSVLALLWANSGWAYVVPPSASADRMMQQSLGTVPDLLVPKESETAGEAPLLPRPPDADKISLTLDSIKLEGVRAFKPEELAPLWQDTLTHPVTLEDVYAVADRLTRYYRDQGYVLARAYLPEQEICCGSAIIAVTEGQIGEVRLEGPVERTNLISLALQRIRDQAALNIKTLENQLLLLGDLPGSNFRVVLKPGAEGTVDVVVVGEKEPTLRGSITFDNSGSRYLGPYMVSASLQLYNLPFMFHQTTLGVSSSLQRRELSMVSLSHQMPLWYPGLSLTVDASYTRGQPGYTLKVNDIESNAFQFGMHVDWQVLRQRTGSLTLTAGATLHNSDTNILSLPFTHDNIRELSAGVRYDWRDFMEGYNLAQLVLSQGIAGVLGGSHTGDADLSRAAGQADYTKAEVSLMRTQPIGQDFTLFGALTGQLSSGPLLSSEEFGYGGSFIGRAYDASEMTGDSGAAMLLELRYRPLELKDIGMIEPFVFTDYGALWNRDAGEPPVVNGASLGVGARLVTEQDINAEMLFAQPLLRSHQSTYPNVGGPRLLFSVKARF